MKTVRNRFFQLNIGRNALGEPCFLLWFKPKPRPKREGGEVWQVSPDGTVSITQEPHEEGTR